MARQAARREEHHRRQSGRRREPAVWPREASAQRFTARRCRWVDEQQKLVPFLLALTGGAKDLFCSGRGFFGDMSLIGAGGSIWPCCATVFHDGPRNALEAVSVWKAKKWIPSHYNTWPPIATDAQQWAERVRSQTQAEPIVVQPGQAVTL